MAGDLAGSLETTIAMTMRLRSLTTLTQTVTSSGSILTMPSKLGAKSKVAVLSTRLCLVSATASLLALSGCTDNYITNKYYTEDDSGTSAPTTAADAQVPASSSEPTDSTDSSEPGTEVPGTSADEDAGTTSEPVTDEGTTGETVPAADAGSGEGPAEEDAAVDEPERPFMDGAPKANTETADFDVDVFGKIGNRYWLAADPAQVELMNGSQGGGGPIFDVGIGVPVKIGAGGGEIYTPGGDTKTFIESLFVSTPGLDPEIADFGKLSVRVVGQSTFHPWTRTTIPNLRLDMDHFAEGQRLGGYEHLRFNNGLVGTIFREKLTLDLYRKLGYPAPHTQFAWVGSNVWGPDVWIPYTLVQVYKKSFCDEYSEQFGGGCENMWEYVGDFGQGIFEDPASCQSDECDNTRAKELDEAVATTPWGDGFKAALDDKLDWESFHEYQCLSWVLAVGDDSLHNTNNVVLVERTDGKFQFLPYSTDISLGQSWYPQVQLTGTNNLAQGCQADAECWADTVATCDRIVQEFTALEPGRLLDETYAALEAEGMLRNGDDDFYAELSAWFEDRLVALPLELDDNRESPQLCVDGQVWCNGYCTEPQYCDACQPPIGKPPQPIDGVAIALPDGDVAPVPEPFPLPVPVDMDGGADGGGVIDVPPPNQCGVVAAYKIAK
jgi:CotH kinase protein